MFRWLVFPFWAISRNSATLPGDFICCFFFVCLFVCFWRRRESHAGHGRRGYRPSVIQIRGGGLSGIIQTSTPTLRWQETIHQKKNDVPRQFYLASQKKNTPKRKPIENQNKPHAIRVDVGRNCCKKKIVTKKKRSVDGHLFQQRRTRLVTIPPPGSKGSVCECVCVCVCNASEQIVDCSMSQSRTNRFDSHWGTRPRSPPCSATARITPSRRRLSFFFYYYCFYYYSFFLITGFCWPRRPSKDVPRAIRRATLSSWNSFDFVVFFLQPFPWLLRLIEKKWAEQEKKTKQVTKVTVCGLERLLETRNQWVASTIQQLESDRVQSGSSIFLSNRRLESQRTASK